MTSVLGKSYGNKDFTLAELRNFRLHIYATLAAMNADVSTAQARAAYCIETDRTYFGKVGAWIGLSNASTWQDAVPTVPDLPVTDTDGFVRVVLDDGTAVGPTIWVYSSAHGGWHKQGDPGIVLKDGTVKFTGIPGVSSGLVVPVAATDLTTKAYVDVISTALATHIADPTAHAAEIASAISTHDTTPTAHAAEFAAALATAAAAATADLNTHKADPAAHATAIAAAITTHDGNPTAHLAEIASLIATHNADPAAHAAGIAGTAAGGGGGGGPATSSGADGAFSLSGQNIIENARVVTGGHGTPCVTRPYESVYRRATELEEPCGIIWRPSTQQAFGSGSVIFDNATPKITIPTTVGLTPGQVVTFASSVSNAGVFFTVTTVIDGTNIGVSPAPVNETIATAMTSYALDGIIIFSGKFFIDASNPIGAPSIASATANVGGHGRIVFTSLAGLSTIRAGDQVVVTGTPSINGTYYVFSVDTSTNSVLLTTVLPASQGSPAGIGTISHPGQTNNFGTFTTLSQKDVTWYTDDADSLGYSTTVGAWELGQQINSSEFVVRIQRAAGTKTATKTGAGSISRKLKQTIPIDSSGGVFALTLFTALANDEVTFIDYGSALSQYPVTINSDGSQQFGPGTATLFVLDYDAQSISIRFVDGKWRLL